MGKDHAAVYAIDGEAVGFDGGTAFEIQLRFSNFFGLGRIRLAFSNGGELAKIADAEDMQNLRELRVLSDAKAAPASVTRWFSRFDDRARQLTAAVTEHERKRPQPVLTEVYTTQAGGQDVFFLRRGEVDRKEGKASPNFIQVLMRSGDAEKKWVPPPEEKKPAIHPRLSLANWMTDAQAGGGPLLARVIVQRFAPRSLQVFGDGPVKLAVVEVQSDLAFRVTAKVVGEVVPHAQVEALMRDALAGVPGAEADWLWCGGGHTLASYGTSGQAGQAAWNAGFSTRSSGG